MYHLFSLDPVVDLFTNIKCLQANPSCCMFCSLLQQISNINGDIIGFGDGEIPEGNQQTLLRLYSFLISFKNLLPFYYYRKAAFCYRLPKNHLISGELITCQTVGMLFVLLHCTVELLLLCFVFVFCFCSLFERGICNRDIHKSYKSHPHSLFFLHYEEDVQVVKL